MSYIPSDFDEIMSSGDLSLLYKDPEGKKKEMINLIERNAPCDRCGEVKLKVVSFENRKLKCENCGHEQ